MKKKLLSLLLALCLLLSLPAVSSADGATSGACGENADWSYDASTATLTISGSGPMYDYTMGVDEANRPWIHLRTQIRHLVIEDGITRIGESAFCSFSNLETITFADTVTEIGHYAFMFAEKLTELELPSRLACIGQQAFWCCRALTEIHLPGSLTFIDACVFADCTGVKKVTIGYDPSVHSLIIGNSIFQNCTALESIQVDEDHFGLKSIDDVLYSCDANGLTLQQYPLGKKGTEFRIPEETILINICAIWNAVHLETVIVPEDVACIRDSGIAGGKLKAVYFQGSAPELDRSALGVNPMTVYYPADDPSWTPEVMQTQYHTITWEPYNPANPFRDVPLDVFYEDPVLWAVENGITNGLTATEFGPDAACNRAQVVTFLWRAEGCPEPTAASHSFVDVQAGSFYEKAVAWAVENEITTGTDATHFSPNAPCNRATVVTFLHRAADAPAVENANDLFSDVPADSWFTAPVLWAVERGITNGLSATEFGPNANCNRAQIVTFLYRAYTD